MKKVLVSLVLILSIFVIFGSTVPSVIVYAADGFDESSDDDDTYVVDDSSNVTYEDDDYFDYEGDIDLYTGLPKGSEESIKSAEISVTDGITYNMESHMFNFAVSGGTFSSSVTNKMVTTGAVNFAVSGEFNVAVYKDGAKLNGIPKSVSEDGSYTVLTWDDNSEKQLMSFQIVKKETGRLSQYVMPDGFVAKSVYKDGVETDKGFGSVDLTKEGYYEITYTCSSTGIDYNLQINVDHTPPQVTFEGLDKKDKARGPVTVKGLESEDRVSVTRDKRKTSLGRDNTLDESGVYNVLVTDKAGNTTTKSFEILMYMNIKSVFLIIAFVAILVAIGVALYITRKNLRVR